jgi:hypothetical protein
MGLTMNGAHVIVVTPMKKGDLPMIPIEQAMVIA